MFVLPLPLNKRLKWISRGKLTVDMTFFVIGISDCGEKYAGHKEPFQLYHFHCEPRIPGVCQPLFCEIIVRITFHLQRSTRKDKVRCIGHNCLHKTLFKWDKRFKFPNSFHLLENLPNLFSHFLTKAPLENIEFVSEILIKSSKVPCEVTLHYTLWGVSVLVRD